MLSCVVISRHHPRRSSPSRHCDGKFLFRDDFRPFLSYTSALFHFPYPLSLLLATHTKTAGCVPTIPILKPSPHAPILAPLFPLSSANLMSFLFTLLCTLLHFFALPKISTPLFSSNSALCAKKRSVRASHFGLAPNSQRNPPWRITEHASRTTSHEPSHRPIPTVSGSRYSNHLPRVAAFSSECYDLVFHDPC